MEKKHRFSDAIHMIADNTNLTIEYISPSQREWHKGSYYVIDKGDRDGDIHIRIKDGDKILWTEKDGIK